ncbi:MAG TPA: endonuclease/exonuclease/phosphatase family protein [Polyangiaceae bacterium]|nr:endonuclease/exonuclease/phosphatase family protein [Polyangiaceae bacterium]
MANYEMSPSRTFRGALGALALAGALFVAGTSEGTETAKRTGSLDTGTFTLLTYNVAGLPELVSESDPVANIPIISSLLNLYDVALVQEDFAYHDALAAHASHQYQSPALVPNEHVGIGDGLNEFSRFPYSHFERVTWSNCNGRLSDGSDCLAPKGFTVATHDFGNGVEVDLYNVHLDAGHSTGDFAARSTQLDQLLSYVGKHSAGKAVIIAGDTNMSRDSEDLVAAWLKRAGLTDACRALACDNPNRIDRVMYRSSSALELRAVRVLVDSRFVTKDGKDLSDHKAVGTLMEWRKTTRTASR